MVFIRDQVKPEDLWLPRDWARENLPTRQWLLDNGLSFENSFTNTAMCSSPATAAASTGLLSDIENPGHHPRPKRVLMDQGYDVSFFEPFLKTVRSGGGAGQDMKPENAGGGYRLPLWHSSANDRPFAMVVSLVNPHDVLSYPLTWSDEDGACGALLPPTVTEPISTPVLAKNGINLANYKPQIQREPGTQPLPTDQKKLNWKSDGDCRWPDG